MEAEKTEAQAEVDDIRQRLSEIKHKHESILIENTTKVALEDHVTSVSELKRLVIIFFLVKSGVKEINSLDYVQYYKTIFFCFFIGIEKRRNKR